MALYTDEEGKDFGALLPAAADPVAGRECSVWWARFICKIKQALRLVTGAVN